MTRPPVFTVIALQVGPFDTTKSLVVRDPPQPLSLDPSRSRSGPQILVRTGGLDGEIGQIP